MSRAKRVLRSGLIKARTEVTIARSVEQEIAGLAKLAEHTGLPASARRALQRIEEAEATALVVFARAKLPTVNGPCHRIGSGPWTAGPGPSTGETVQRSHLTLIGKQEFLPDTEGGFATRILELVLDAKAVVRRAEKAGDTQSLYGFLTGFDLALQACLLGIEFKLGQWIAPERSAVRGRKQGGEQTARNTRSERKPVWDEWRASAQLFWSKNPSGSVSSAARYVAQHFPDAKPSGIRRRINKPAQAESTAPTS